MGHVSHIGKMGLMSLVGHLNHVGVVCVVHLLPAGLLLLYLSIISDPLKKITKNAI